MNQIVHCDWLFERARWSHLALSGLPTVTREKNFLESHIINLFIDQACSVKMAGYWPRSFLRVYGSSRSMNTWPAWQASELKGRERGKTSAQTAGASRAHFDFPPSLSTACHAG